ncbi:hypothetical protein LV779_26305 [Streptomyces thinghirensis]|nr:hypothetical protein [Streptomyces thinghirensis]
MMGAAAPGPPALPHRRRQPPRSPSATCRPRAAASLRSAGSAATRSPRRRLR